jgi:hypothetical protein
VFGDGAVHSISYNIDRVIFNRMGDRMDRQVIDASNYTD